MQVKALIFPAAGSPSASTAGAGVSAQYLKARLSNAVDYGSIDAVFCPQNRLRTVFDEFIRNSDPLELKTSDPGIIKYLQNSTTESALADIFLDSDDSRYLLRPGAQKIEVQRLYKAAVDNRCGYALLHQFRMRFQSLAGDRTQPPVGAAEYSAQPAWSSRRLLVGRGVGKHNKTKRKWVDRSDLRIYVFRQDGGAHPSAEAGSVR